MLFAYSSPPFHHLFIIAQCECEFVAVAVAVAVEIQDSWRDDLMTTYFTPSLSPLCCYPD
jgi:hypothetical protein